MFWNPRARRVFAAFLVFGALAGCRPATPASSPLIVDTMFNPRWVGLIVHLDSTLFELDTAAVGRDAQMRALRALDGRVIDSIRFFEPDSARRLYGSRAHRGAIRVWVRAR